jgi:peptidoglycan/xylan/chitin deacetylase (PgdA/CDA1 family)
MKALFRLLLTGALANPASSLLLRPLWKGRASIFMLHRTTTYPEIPAERVPELIGTCVKALRNAGASLTSVRTLFEMARRGVAPPPGSVAFTIDDGYCDQATIATAFLRNDCPVTVFLVSGFMDGDLWPWDERLAYAVLNTTRSRVELATLQRRFELQTPEYKNAAVQILQNACKSLPWTQVGAVLEELWLQTGVLPPKAPLAVDRAIGWQDARALEREGVDFAPHSVTHRVASQLPAEESDYEIVHSVERLKAELVRPLPVYAWPTGRSEDFGHRDMLLAQKHGLLGAVSADPGYSDFKSAIRTPVQMFAIRRFAFSAQTDVNVQYGTGIEELKNRMRGMPSSARKRQTD